MEATNSNHVIVGKENKEFPLHTSTHMLQTIIHTHIPVNSGRAKIFYL